LTTTNLWKRLLCTRLLSTAKNCTATNWLSVADHWQHVYIWRSGTVSAL